MIETLAITGAFRELERTVIMEILLPEQIEELSRVFRAFDSQGKQSLNVRELGACFK